MALDFGTQINNAQRSNQNTQAERPKTQYWMNIGYEAADGTFIALPVGIPLDTMEKRQVRGSNEAWNKLQHASNKLLDLILAGAKELDAGEEEVANGLQIRIKRIAADATVGDDNEMLQGMENISFLRKSDTPKDGDTQEPQVPKGRRQG